ncbi:MAG: site-specific DNA-methyltransferase [Chloroflexota bacterium]|nr:site-specific DNA-methyltransferase [Chloroflexota bacterium]MDE2683116.1 site-specific DNA-methyltransferase [Chloroflexota bacterium]
MTDRNFANRTLYHGDNLDFLRGMNSGTVNLIATDPPFNKGRDFHADPDSLAAGASFPDRWSWRDDVHDEWLIAIQRDEPEVWQVITAAKTVYGDDMGAFLCWLGVRLLEMHRILTDNGSLYLHMDDTAGAWGKCLLDAVFGKAGFRNSITWQRHNAHSNANRFGNVTDTIHFYVKGNPTWNPTFGTYSAEQLKRYKQDDDGRYYRGDDLTAPSPAPSRIFTWRGTTPKHGWRYSREHLESLWEQGLILTKRDGSPRLDGHKKYLDEMQGKPLQNLWADIPRIANTSNERTGYPTQKPLALYERIIKASSNPGDMVLDPFCGCATTPVAAERLGRQWVGMDIWDKAHPTVLDRLETEGLAVPNRRGRNRQAALVFGDVTYATAPPKGRTTASRPRSRCGRQREGVQLAIPPRVHSTGNCWPTWVHSVRDAGGITGLTPACWRLTTSGPGRTAEATPTTTSRCYVRRAIERSGTVLR